MKIAFIRVAGHAARVLSIANIGMSAEAIVFFFSSRRRHTRFDCDWSSDVCSSDLVLSALVMARPPHTLSPTQLFRGLRSEEHTSELQSQSNLVCRLLLEKKKTLPSSSTTLSSFRTPAAPTTSFRLTSYNPCTTPSP